MPSAQTPADQLPLLFHAAPGWPTPTLEWVTTHLGWQPPPGWVPMVGCPHSPPRWPFWSRNEAAWARLARPHLRSARRNWWAGVLLILLLLFAVYTMYGSVSEAPPLWNILVPAVGLITVLVKMRQARASMRRTEAELMAHIRESAERFKLESDRAHYERYLRSSGDN